MNRFLLILQVLCCSYCVMAQDLLTDLAFYGDVMINAYEPEHRKRAGSEFNTLIDTYIAQEVYKTDKWNTLKSISRLQANQDSTVILLTWQIDEGSYPLSYGGYILIDGKATKLTQTTKIDRDIEYMSVSNSDWYGALYYGLRPLKGSKDKYLIFGYQHNEKFDKTKIVDILDVSGGSITFGSELFVTESEDTRDDVKLRKLLTYSSDTNASLNYNEALDMIVFDHLMPRMGQQEGQENTYVPDGTYEGYEWKGGKFIYIEKIFDHIYEEAPRPEAILDGREKNIIGKSKK